VPGKIEKGIIKNRTLVMKQCTFPTILLSRYVDHDLAGTELKAVDDHVASCRECHSILESYAAIKDLVCDSFSEAVAERENPAACKAPEKNIVRFPGISRGLRIAAVLVITVAGAGVYSVMRIKHPIPAIIETESASMMNTPLGSLVYYEELSGKAVHSQFRKIAATTYESFQETATDLNRISQYKSPLFQDGSVLDKQYSAIKNSVVF
jgi:hypothetical protein